MKYDKLTQAKASLIVMQPFFATILMSQPITLREDLPFKTMATDGRHIWVHPEFLEKSSVDELKFALCHEAMHVVFAHMFRRGARNHRKWNIAGDYVINDLLVKENVGKAPHGVLINPHIVQEGGGTTEGVYEKLPDDDGGKGGGGNGGEDQWDDCMDAQGSPSEQAQAEAEARVMVAQAAQAAKMAGKLSAGLQRFVDSAMKPKIDWRECLRRFIYARAKTEYSWARPKRRFLAEDLYLPSLGGEKMGKILIAVDCSGSIGQKELNEFAAEMASIKNDVRPEAIDVLYFDSRVCHHDHFEQDEDLVVEPHGGGGTAFSPIFAYTEEHDIDPVCCVVLTDLYCSDFGPAPDYPVMWITNGATTAPWGQVIEMDPKL